MKIDLLRLYCDSRTREERELIQGLIPEQVKMLEDRIQLEGAPDPLWKRSRAIARKAVRIMFENSEVGSTF